MHKTCTLCKETKEISEFVVKTISLDGYRNQCKPCVNARKKANLTPEKRALRNAWHKEYSSNNPELLKEQRRAYREKNREALILKHKEYNEKNKVIKNLKSKEHYEKNKERITEYFASRRHIKAAYDKEYVAANKDRIAIRGAEYKKANPDKVRQHAHKRRAVKENADGTYSTKDITRIYGLQKGKCAYCSTKVGKAYHVDHIQPLARGGTNWPDNLQILCPSCNVKKWALDPIVYAQRLGMLL